MARPLDVQRLIMVLFLPHSPRRNAYYLPRIRLSMVSYILALLLAAWRFMNHVPSDVTRKIYSGTGFVRNSAGVLELIDKQEVGK